MSAITTEQGGLSGSHGSVGRAAVAPDEEARKAELPATKRVDESHQVDRVEISAEGFALAAAEGETELQLAPDELQDLMNG